MPMRASAAGRWIALLLSSISCRRASYNKSKL
jgi:hypothetical protein